MNYFLQLNKNHFWSQLGDLMDSTSNKFDSKYPLDKNCANLIVQNHNEAQEIKEKKSSDH